MSLTSTAGRLLPAALLLAAGTLAAADLRLGVIGTDTSHVPAFAGVLNDESNPKHIAGAKIVAAYKGGSADLKESAGRVDKYAGEVKTKYNVAIVDKIQDLCSQVDGILLESVDGRIHLPQMKEAVKCGKPIFIDKPMAASLEDALAIDKLAKAANVPWFSSSSLRYGEIETLTQAPVKGALVWGPGPTEEHQPIELPWYGIHAVEMLYTLMGPGCVEVTQTSSADADVISGSWKDGRIGTVRVDRPYMRFGAVAFRANNDASVIPNIKVDYVPMLAKVVDFIKTGKTPVPNEVTLKMFRFMDAAHRSKTSGGKAAKL